MHHMHKRLSPHPQASHAPQATRKGWPYSRRHPRRAARSASGGIASSRATPCGWPVRLAWLILFLLVLLASCSLPGNPTPAPTPTATITGAGVSTPTPKPTPESLANLLKTEQLLLMTPHPLRDLYGLAQQLKLHTAAPIPHVGRTTPLNEKVGQEDAFWLNNSDTRTYSRIHAKLVYITPHLYVYVEDGQSVNMAALQASADLFERSIYATDRTTFGSE